MNEVMVEKMKLQLENLIYNLKSEAMVRKMQLRLEE